MQTALEGGKLGQNVLDCLKQGAVDFAAAEAAGGIGDLRTDGDVDYVTHKLLHGILGGVMAEMSGSDFASGALGAVVAETIGELVADMKRPRDDDDDDKSLVEDQFEALDQTAEAAGRELSADEVHELSRKYIEAEALGTRAAFIGKLAAIGSALAVGADVEGAALAANNAVENNLRKHIVTYVLVSAGMYLTARSVKNAYVEAGGGEAGMIAAAQALGEDIALAVVGGVAIKVIARTGQPVVQFLKDYGQKIPMVGDALRSAEKAVAAGVGKVREGVGYVAEKVGQKVGIKPVQKDLVGGQTLSAEANAGAQSAADAARHRTELLFKEQGLLDANGKLTQKAIDESIVIKLSDGAISNPSVVAELTKDGSKIADWAKCTSIHVTNLGGQKLQIHYYKNIKTGKIDYTTSDFKVKQVIDALK